MCLNSPEKSNNSSKSILDWYMKFILFFFYYLDNRQQNKKKTKITFLSLTLRCSTSSSVVVVEFDVVMYSFSTYIRIVCVDGKIFSYSFFLPLWYGEEIIYLWKYHIERWMWYASFSYIHNNFHCWMDGWFWCSSSSYTAHIPSIIDLNKSSSKAGRINHFYKW